jgi:hypothetical protein
MKTIKLIYRDTEDDNIHYEFFQIGDEEGYSTVTLADCFSLLRKNRLYPIYVLSVVY